MTKISENTAPSGFFSNIRDQLTLVRGEMIDEPAFVPDNLQRQGREPHPTSDWSVLTTAI
ncbi:hypothetical protein OAG82_01035 [Rubripirellula sp.]|nr:hypothetical protein [Rubripirellula sp.]